MAKDIETLKQQALQIKNEVEDGANTSDRVGGMFSDILDYNEEKRTELEEKSVYRKKINFEQGEFNLNLDPIEFNNDARRIRTIINISNVKKLYITNTENYEISAGFYTDCDLNLDKSKIKVANILDYGSAINIADDIKSVSEFVPAFLIVSFRNRNNPGNNIKTVESKDLGLKLESCNTVYEIENSNNNIEVLFGYNGISKYHRDGFEQGEFNFNYDPVQMTYDPKRIRRIFSIDNISKIKVLNPDYQIRYYVLMQENESLNRDDTSYGSVFSNELDVLNLSNSQSKIDAKKILLSFGKINEDNITPENAENAKIIDISNDSQDKKEIVCPGDSLTAGDGVGEYPMELQKILGDNYTVINQGVGGETSHTILVRVGSESVYSQYDFILPNAGQKVLIADGTTGKYLKNATSDGNVTPLLQNVSERVNPCYVNGVRCIMTREYSGESTNASVNKWYLTPEEDGKNITIKKGTPIILQGSNVCRNKDLLIEWIGTNDGQSAIQSDIDGFVKRLRNSVQFANPKCCIILNPHVFVLEDFDNALRKEFGNQFFNWRVYVSSVALYEFGITPTTQETLTELQKQNGVLSDVECMEAGTLPSSLWRRAYRSADDPLNDTGRVENEKDSTHMNVMGYKILATKLSQLINELGL